MATWSLGAPALRHCVYLLCFAGDEVADGLAEEAGQQGVEGRLLLQEAVQRLQQALVPPELVVDVVHVRGQEFAGDVRVPMRGGWGGGGDTVRRANTERVPQA